MELLSKEQFKALPLAHRLKVLYDPFYFLAYCAYTRDEVDQKAPIKGAPVWPDTPGYKPYIEPITRIWQQEPLVIVDKARRMWISYLMLCLHLHLAFTNTDRRIAIVSKKFEDACAHLDNMLRIYDAIPEDIWPRDVRPTVKKREGLITFEEVDSMIHAVASGPDQMRQFGYTAIFLDEFDFTEKQELTYGALMPTIQNGGKLTIATTHAFVDTGVESFYRKLFEDRI